MKLLSLTALVLCGGVPMLAQAPAPQAAAAPNIPGLTLQVGGSTAINLYGILDAGIAHVQHTAGFDSYFPGQTNPTATKNGVNSATGMMNGGISPSRIGIKVASNLGSGFTALGTLESGINVPTGNVSNAALGIAQSTSAANAQFMNNDSSVSGQLFNRGAFVGVSHNDYGTLTFGRQNSLLLDVVNGYDALQAAQMFTVLGYSGAYGGGGATDNSRVDDSVKYKVKYQDFTLAGLYKFAGNAGNPSVRSVAQVTLAYETGPFGIQVGYSNNKDATSIASADSSTTVPGTQPTGLGLVNATFFNTNTTMVTAKYKFDHAYLNAGYEREGFTNPSNPAADLLVTSLFGQTVNVAGTSVSAYNDGKKILSVYWLGANYNLTDQFNVGLEYTYVGQNDYSNGHATTKEKNGNAKYYSVMLDYTFTKAFDTYLGYMYNGVTGGMAAGYLCDNNAVTAIGMRLKF